MRALTLQRPGADAPTLLADLQAAGIHVIGAVQRSTLVQEVIRQSPELLVCVEHHPDEALFQQLKAVQSYAQVAVLLFTNDADALNIERALQAGVHAYVVNGYAAARLRPLVQLARARRAHDSALREQLDELTQRFEERKLVDRAKGLLMAARALSEGEAFKVLRDLAMQGGQRIGEVAQQLIESARSAADINRSGQLRMLSQRLVLLQALALAGASPAAALRVQKTQAVARADALVEGLGKDLSAATFGDLHGALLLAWQGLRAALAGAGDVAATDALAEELLQQSNRLTDALEGAGAAATLQVINVAGRQRMLSQRLAKLLLLAALDGTRPDDEAQRVRAQFEQAQALLRATPLSTPEIRQALDAADGHWRALLDGAARVQTGGGVQDVVSASEALLQALETLTGQYESSLQVLLG